jgi:beta-aspartyl-dipeptidase (metallo-type)
VDLTAFPTDGADGGLLPGDREVSAADAVVRFLNAGLPLERLTVSSDGGGCLPTFDGQGEMLRMGFATSASLADLLADLLARGVPLEQALAPLTRTPARLLRLRSKGAVAVGMDADLVLLGPDGRPADVMARGRWHVRDGRPVLRGLFEA